MPWLLLFLIPVAAAAAVYKKKSDAAATDGSLNAIRPGPPLPLDAATVLAASQGVPAAVDAQNQALAAQAADASAQPTSIEFPDNQQGAQAAAQATADQQAQNYQTVQQADAKLQAALGNPPTYTLPVPAPAAAKVYSADYATAVYQKALDAGQSPAAAEALRQQAIKDYSPGNFDPITGVPYRINDTRTLRQKQIQAATNTQGTMMHAVATKQWVGKKAF
jgi:hypothetical protein